jgi:SAM-dependent methyltransferase
MNDLINKLHQSKFLGRIFHTLDYCLQKELADCESVLDLGCGPSSPLQHCKNIKYSVGVEAFKPYLATTQTKKIHSEYLAEKIEEVDFPEKSFDAVILIEVLEHLPEETGRLILQKAEKWAKKKVIVTTPNGYFPMDAVDENSFQRHQSGWTAEQMKGLGFTVHGLSGTKFFYLNKNTVHSLVNQPENYFSNIRFKPKKLFYGINALFQVFTYYFPGLSFGLFLVKSK